MIDLRIGNPDLIIELFQQRLAHDVVVTSIMSGMPYYKEGPLPAIVKQIKELHEKYHPNLLTPNSQIVVASGASQLISAFFALNKRAYVQTPYWFRTPTLAAKQKSEMIEFALSANDVNLITYPNNPDGALVLSTSQKTWYDCAYLWPWYFDSSKDFENSTNNLVNTKKTATIFTLSKMTGHCGIRFGWAIVEDANIAKTLNEYIEYESGGVGYDTQIKAKTVMETLLNEESWQNELDNAASILAERKDALQAFCHSNEWSCPIAAGMFAWVTIPNGSAVEVFQKMGILGTCGTKSGGGINQIRLNLAVSQECWEDFLRLVYP
jgi:aspartate/methionine/tyrosine aminotransferase